jgi:transposase
MGAAYPQALRDRVLAACDRGMKTKQVADLFEVSSSWVRRVKQRRREHGETSPRPCGGATVVKIDLDRLAEVVQKHPDATIKELHALLGADCVASAVGVALKRLGLTFKKRPFMRRSKTGRT